MNEMGPIWGGWIIGLTLISLAGLLWLLLSVYLGREEKTDKPGSTDAVWDETLKEGDHPAPWWWFYLTLSFMIFSVLYLILYPGLGPFKGALQWTQDGQLHDSIKADKERYGELRRRWSATPLHKLAEDETAMRTANRIFRNNCTACHGDQGRGQKGFPNLLDNDWQWGDSIERIEETLRQGRRAQMPPWHGVISDDDIRHVTDYVLALGRNEADNPDYHTGASVFKSYCAVCHSENGTGNIALGAPDLTDEAWLYGGSRLDIYRTIHYGRNGVMPAQAERLSPLHLRLLTAWLRGGWQTALEQQDIDTI